VHSDPTKASGRESSVPGIVDRFAEKIVPRSDCARSDAAETSVTNWS
jgi:hypothetical protein